MILGRRQRKPAGPKPIAWRGYRNCDRCTRWRPVSDFTVYRTRTGFEQIKGECDHCKRQREKERYDALTPEQKRAKGKKANKQAQKRRDKALVFIERQRRILDEQNHKIEILSDKIDRARKANRPPRGTVNGSAVEITPFRMWLLRKHRETGYNVGELAQAVEQDPSRVKRWLDGYMWNSAGRDPDPIRAIDVGTVDAIGVAMNDPGLLERLYPLEVDVDV